ncbi:MAG: hypothetical protein WC830_22155 [Burkholderiales bacterium]|jgi:hypothetical protein
MTTATATRGPKITGTPGQLPEIPDAPDSAASAAEVGAEPRPVVNKHTVVVKDLAKKPHQEEAAPGALKEPEIEASTIEEGLELANKRNRAVFTPFGYVCPSIIRERR